VTNNPARCISKGCRNAPVGECLCAIHHPDRVEQDLNAAGAVGQNLSSTDRGKGLEEGASGVPTDARQQASVNASEGAESKSCRALTKSGKPCKSPTVGPDGYCATHSGRAGFGTAEMARKGSEASVRARRERVAERERRTEEAAMSLTELLKVRALERREELVKALLDAAAQGRDVPALRMVWDRLDGKVADKLELEAALPQSLADIRAMSPEQRLAFIRQRTAELESS
jgi:hypothetical protein